MNVYLWTAIASALGLGMLLIAAASRSRNYRYKRAHILTNNELEFYRRLQRALPGLEVLPQVSMAGVIRPNESNSKRWNQALWMVVSKRIDFTICRRDMSVLCVVELDDRTHDKTKDAQRDAILASAGIGTIRYQSRNKPNEQQIHQDVRRFER